MLSVWMVLGAIGLLGVSGLPAYLFSIRSMSGQRAAVFLMAAGSVLGLGGTGLALCETAPPALRLPWFLPAGEFSVAIDAISALFLAPVFIIPALGAIYGLGYWRQTDHPSSGRRLGLFYGLLAGAMAGVVIARDGVLFLIVWEAMAIAAYFAASADEHNPEVRRAGWVYLIATHAGTLLLIAMFALWRHTTGSFALDPAAMMPAAAGGTLFVLALTGFGFKAGLMPLHVWLPGAHANAPSHVSAVMSGVMLKMGVYGLVRMTALLPSPALWWGGVLLGAGAVTGIAGIAFAIGQQDIKRLLAYSSVENIGIIAMGLGLALLGRTEERADWIVLGLGSALLHVWNHALFKPLLFFNAGAVIHAAGTREMDRMGGLAKLMPRSAFVFALGAVAICALPPLNGFVSEWLLYAGLFRTLGIGGASAIPAAAVAAAGLAMTGALAAACFVKFLGTVYLGSPRSAAAAHAHDPHACMMWPMAALLLGCAAVGVFPMPVLPLMERAARVWAAMPGAAQPALGEMAPAHWISLAGLLLLLLIGAIALLRARPVSQAETGGQPGTWDCGYAQPTARMQYTGSSFGEMLTGLFAFIVWPRRQRPKAMGLIPGETRFQSTVPDTVLERLLLPVFCFAERHLPRLRVLQQGQTQLYVLYVLATVFILLCWGAMEAHP